MRRAVILLFFACGCGNPSRGVQMEINFQPSCTAVPSTYNIECVSALYAQLVDESGSVLEDSCSRLSAGTFFVATDLARSSSNEAEIVTVLENIAPREGVAIELRGYHGQVRDPCLGEQPDVADLMFWGRSDVVNLTDDNVRRIRIDIECRDSCDCSELGSASCPLDFDSDETVRVCSPNALCRASNCTAACWDGEVPCGSGGRCEPEVEKMCWECDSAADCGDGLVCVLHDLDALPDEKFCAKTCPTDLAACPGTMGCRMVDGTDLTVLP